MAEKELDLHFKKEAVKSNKIVKINESEFKRLLVSLYLTAESWARQKGVELEDIEIVNQEISADDTNATWKFIKNPKAEVTETSSGLLGPNGLPIELGM